MSWNHLGPQSEEEAEQQLQVALAMSLEDASVQEDQTSATAAAASPEGLAEAEDDRLVVASCAGGAPPAVGVRGHVKAAAVKASKESMLPKVRERAFNAGRSGKEMIEGTRTDVEKTPQAPALYRNKNLSLIHI